MKKDLFILIIAVVLSACGGVSSSEKKCTEGKGVKEKPYKYASMKNGVLHLDLNEARKHPREVKLSEICDSIIYIPLETKKECLLGKGGKLHIDGEDLFYKYSWGLYHFNIDGRFIGQIGKIGRGPGEYVCTNFTLNKKRKNVYAFANYKHRLLIFDYKGKLLSDKVKASISDKMMYNEVSNTILSTEPYVLERTAVRNTSKYYLLKEVDMRGRNINSIESKYFPEKYKVPVSKNELSVSFNGMYMYRDSCVRINELASDTLFEYRKNKLEPIVILNNKLYKQEFTADNLSKARKTGQMKTIMPDQVIGESGRYIFIDGSEAYLYDKTERELCRVQADRDDNVFVNDMDGIFNGRVKQIINNEYIQSIESADDFMEKAEELVLDEKNHSKYKSRIQNLLTKIKEESNPVLILYRLKK